VRRDKTPRCSPLQAPGQLRQVACRTALTSRLDQGCRSPSTVRYAQQQESHPCWTQVFQSLVLLVWLTAVMHPQALHQLQFRSASVVILYRVVCQWTPVFQSLLLFLCMTAVTHLQALDQLQLVFRSVPYRVICSINI
jgi:hypothetical protein